MSQEFLSQRYKKAADLVCILFADLRRQITNVPYVAHLFGVAHIVEQFTDDQDIIIAALLHDVLEDIPATKYSADNMRRDFGSTVLEIVQTVSHNEEEHGWWEARQRYLEQIKNGPLAACLVSAADLLYNCADYLDSHQLDAIEAERVIQKNAKNRIKFYSQRLDILADRLGEDHELIEQLRPTVEAVIKINQKVAERVE